MTTPHFLTDLLILLGLGVTVVVVFHRIGLPPTVGFLLSGFLCGPFGLGWIGSVHEVEALAEIGVVLLLFTVGIEFSISELTRLRTQLLAGGSLQVLGTIAATALLMVGLGTQWRAALFFGMLISLSSTAVVIRLLADRAEIDSPHGRSALTILVFQDLCIVPMVLLAPFLSGAGGDLAALGAVALKAVLFVAAAVLAARYAVPWLLHRVVRTRRREVFILTVVLLGLGVAWASAQVGLSLALGAFIAGLIISESEYSHQALGEILPLREVFNSLFFVSIGMLLDGRMLLKTPLLILALFGAVIILKAGLTAGATLLVGQPLRIAVLTGLALAQIGEFSFVLSKVGLTYGLLDAKLNQLFLAVAVLTIAATPGMHALGPRCSDWLAQKLPRRWSRGRGLPLTAGRGRQELSDHVIVIGYGINGRNLARTLRHLAIPHVVVEMNPEIVRSERAKAVPILFGDATRPEILECAAVRSARVVVLAISDAAATRRSTGLIRRLHPSVPIIVRSRYVQEIEPLFRLGAQEVVPEEFETSIEILTRVLQRYLVPRDVIEEAVQQIRRDGYEMFRSLYEAHLPVEGLQRTLSDLSFEVCRVEPDSAVAGKRLDRSRLRDRTGATVVAIERSGGQRVVNPAPTEIINAGDAVVLLGQREQLTAAARLLRREQPESPPDAIQPQS